MAFERQRPVGGGQPQVVQLDRPFVAGGSEFQGGGTEFGQGSVDFAPALEPGQHALGIQPDGQWLAGQVWNEGLEIGHVQFGLGRPGGLRVERLADFAVQIQRGRAGDVLGQLQPVAQFALDVALTVEGSISRRLELPVHLDLEWIAAGGIQAAAQPRLALGRPDFQGFDAQALGLGTDLEVDGVDLDRFGVGWQDANVAALQVADGDRQRQANVGQNQRFPGGGRGFLAGRQMQFQAVEVQPAQVERPAE